PHRHRRSLGQGVDDAWSRAVRILSEDARDALFVHVAQIKHIPEPGFHPGEDAGNVPSTLELLEEDLERVSAMQAPRRDGPPRLIAAEIQYMIGRGRLTRNIQVGGYRPLHRYLLSPPSQRGRPHTLRDTLRDTSHLALGYTGDPLRQKSRILARKSVWKIKD